MSEYRVNLDIFAGPLDLLLYLVRREEVDIYDIPIAKITQQYIEYIEMLKMFDLELAGEFLVMAATLMEIKSLMLLPAAATEEGGDGQPEDPRSELIRQLLEYKRIKDAANLLEDAAEERRQRFTRSDYILEKIRPSDEPELDLDQVSIWTLLEAFDGIMKSVGNLGDSYKHIHDDTPIDLYQIELLNRLQTDGPMTLHKVFEGRNNRLVMIGLFLAMLELIRNRLIWAEQPELNGPIYLKPLTSEPAEEAVQKIIYASSEALESRPPAAEMEKTEEPEKSFELDHAMELPLLPAEEEENELDDLVLLPDAGEAGKPPIRIMELPPLQQENKPAEPVPGIDEGIIRHSSIDNRE